MHIQKRSSNHGNCEDDTQFDYNIRKIVGLRIWIFGRKMVYVYYHIFKQLCTNIWEVGCMVNRVIEENKDFKIGGVVLEIKILKQIVDYLLWCDSKFYLRRGLNQGLWIVASF